MPSLDWLGYRGVLAMVSFATWVWILFTVSSIAAALALVVKRPPGENRFGSPPKRTDLRRAALSGFVRALDFTGRTSPMEFWSFATAGVLAVVALWGLPTLILVQLVQNMEMDALQPILSYIWPGISVLFAVYVLIAFLSATVRRLHDTNRSGIWVFLALGVGLLLVMYWLIRPSQSRSRIPNLNLGEPLTGLDHPAH